MTSRKKIRFLGLTQICIHTAHQIGALQFQLQKILFITSQKCRDGQQTLISCTSFQILHLQLAVLFQTKSPMSTFSVSGDRILSHIMPRSADDDTVCHIACICTSSTERAAYLIFNCLFPLTIGISQVLQVFISSCH